jgi:tetratricopeptide (TPR) repeat protein
MLVPGFILFILLFYKPENSENSVHQSTGKSEGQIFRLAESQRHRISDLVSSLNILIMRLLRQVPSGTWLRLVDPRNDKFGVLQTKLLLSTVFFFGFLLMIAPVTIRNYAVGHDFVPTNYSNGIFVYVGNWWGSDGSSLQSPSFYRPHPKYEESDQYRMAESFAEQRIKPSDVSGFWVQKALQEVVEDPGHLLTLYREKFLLFINKVELSDNYDYHFYATQIPLLRFLLNSWLIISLAVVSIGLLVYRLSRRLRAKDARFLPNEQLLLLWMLAFYIVLVFLGGMNARYRVPVIPLFIIMAMYGVWYLFMQLKARAYGKSSVFLIGFFVLLWLSSLNLRIFTAVTPANFYNLVGSSYLDRGEDRKAAAYFLKAITARPDYEWAYGNLYTVYMKHGVLGKAYEMLQEAIRLRPDDTENYAKLREYHEVKDKPISYIENRFKQTDPVQLPPAAYDPYFYEATRYLAFGQNAKAEEQFRRSLAERNEPLNSVVTLAMLRKQAGATEEAKALLLKAIKHDVFFLPAQYNLANLYIKEKDPKMATLLLQHIYDFVPEYGEVWPTLAYQYLASGENEAALPIVQAYIKRYDGDIAHQAQVDRFKAMLVTNDASTSGR